MKPLKDDTYLANLVRWAKKKGIPPLTCVCGYKYYGIYDGRPIAGKCRECGRDIPVPHQRGVAANVRD